MNTPPSTVSDTEMSAKRTNASIGNGMPDSKRPRTSHKAPGEDTSMTECIAPNTTTTDSTTMDTSTPTSPHDQVEDEEDNGLMMALDSPDIQAALDACKILVIGAGGLGCEILKNLALTGFKEIHVIDMDTIDLSNLNRQFLFRHKDVGKPKATVAAEFVMQRVPGVKVIPYYGKIQDKDDEYYSQFQLVICGLDSIEARRWINAKLVDMVDDEDPTSLKPLIDGGTEGFKGQARVILPTISSCYECSLDMFNKPTTFPICTIANTPRLPEHCIEWASVLEWPKVWGKDVKYDTDNPEHIGWLYNTALERAQQFKITGVTYALTQGVVKNIIPAIASTNAIIAASCCNEAFKIATGSPFLDNYMMYTGNEGIYTYTFQHQKKPECPVCGKIASSIQIDKTMKLEELIEQVKERPDVQLKKPSLRTSSKSLYMQAPPALETATRPNLTKSMEELIEEGDYITVTDIALPVSIQLKVSWK
ncbi:nedd8 activating enzyme [Lichtheimia corymbifera JMRC:FSU:9682]|uniref:NEDD8-activating enzyme E1 catalytic subunit n=1 Tax=Lichtheimia corymbifera JMRC:FSU:9682 TaxID=1263082 RepID=A0A068S0U8_9FUNG|nr:nedd8 activating enzyme [Lichtheimia corymbifera JMRC:FSU:9682]